MSKFSQSLRSSAELKEHQSMTIAGMKLEIQFERLLLKYSSIDGSRSSCIHLSKIFKHSKKPYSSSFPNVACLLRINYIN